jgi:hypothetical protein
MILAAMRERLLASAPVAALVDQRIHADDEVPQGSAYPAVLLKLLAENPLYDLSGPTGNAECRVQVEAWASTMAEAAAVIEAIRDELEDRRFTYQGWKVGPVHVMNERDLPSLQQVYPAVRGMALDLISNSE